VQHIADIVLKGDAVKAHCTVHVSSCVKILLSCYNSTINSAIVKYKNMTPWQGKHVELSSGCPTVERLNNFTHQDDNFAGKGTRGGGRESE
jgi:hypothetical protein